MAPLYLLDANVLIEANGRYYPLDRIPQFWDWLLTVGSAGSAKLPRQMHGEIQPPDGAFRDWLSHPETTASLLFEEEPDQELLDRVITGGYAPDLSDAELEAIGLDPFLVAYGMAAPERIVVTNEVSKPSKIRAHRRVPDVCRDLGVKCIGAFEFFRLLNFNTVGD